MKIKEESGITLIALAVTVLILVILSVSVTVGIKSTLDVRKYYKVKEDIIALNKAVQSFYLENNGKLPIAENAIEDTSFVSVISSYMDGIDRNPNDNNNYYPIYVGALKEVKLNLPTNVYLINEKTLTVYAKDGYWVNGVLHYTASEKFTGGQFAREYYQSVEPPLITYISFTGQGKDKSVVTFENSVTLKIASSYNFDEYEYGPNIDTIRLKLFDEYNVERATISASRYEVLGNICTYYFQTPEDVMGLLTTDNYLTINYNDLIIYDENRVVEASVFEGKRLSFYKPLSAMDMLQIAINNSMENGVFNSTVFKDEIPGNWTFNDVTNVVTFMGVEGFRDIYIKPNGEYEDAYTFQVIAKNPLGTALNNVIYHFYKGQDEITQKSNGIICIGGEQSITVRASASNYEEFSDTYTVSSITSKNIEMEGTEYDYTVRACDNNNNMLDKARVDIIVYKGDAANTVVSELHNQDYTNPEVTAKVCTYNKVVYYVRAPELKTVNNSSNPVTGVVVNTQKDVKITTQAYGQKQYSFSATSTTSSKTMTKTIAENNIVKIWLNYSIYCTRAFLQSGKAKLSYEFNENSGTIASVESAAINNKNKEGTKYFYGNASADDTPMNLDNRTFNLNLALEGKGTAKLNSATLYVKYKELYDPNDSFYTNNKIWDE